MNAYPEEAKSYENLKIKLSNKFKNDPKKYSEGKHQFIKKIDDKIASSRVL